MEIDLVDKDEVEDVPELKREPPIVEKSDRFVKVIEKFNEEQSKTGTVYAIGIDPGFKNFGACFANIHWNSDLKIIDIEILKNKWICIELFSDSDKNTNYNMLQKVKSFFLSIRSR